MVSIVGMGLMAGVFFAFDVSIMPGLGRTDDRTYATAMRQFNELIESNPLFLTAFLGVLATSAAAAFAAHRRAARPTALWAGAATLCYLVVLVLSFAVNIPLNNELAAIHDPAGAADLSVVGKFKGAWETANILRTVLSTAALAALAEALRRHARDRH
ncbi:DUF1772 domain-containing protein [Streptomyces hoynatensis]|uniref:DUF1772 domain-containing protein n=2 Tax=Streptomyces hoynatensis TaxID=1141874 RepID=A0A3A9YTN6_9ACTN|nr:DUF1772 domain-containing protein [Streptomyces hoynatensis]